MAEDIGVRVVDLRTDKTPDPAVVYIVGSESDKELLQGGRPAGANASIFVIEKGTLEGDNLYNTIVGEQMEAGNFNVVDLRN